MALKSQTLFIFLLLIIIEPYPNQFISSDEFFYWTIKIIYYISHMFRFGRRIFIGNSKIVRFF